MARAYWPHPKGIVCVLMPLNWASGNHRCIPLQIVTFLYKRNVKTLRLTFVFLKSAKKEVRHIAYKDDLFSGYGRSGFHFAWLRSGGSADGHRSRD